MTEQTCYNCDDPLVDCKCSETQTHSSSGAVCPYCGHTNQACNSDGYLYDEGREEWECDDCGKAFRVSVSVFWSWSAYRSEQQ